MLNSYFQVTVLTIQVVTVTLKKNTVFLEGNFGSSCHLDSELHLHNSKVFPTLSQSMAEVVV